MKLGAESPISSAMAGSMGSLELKQSRLGWGALKDPADGDLLAGERLLCPKGWFAVIDPSVDGYRNR